MIFSCNDIDLLLYRYNNESNNLKGGLEVTFKRDNNIIIMKYVH
jgi:hypothetical protein